VQYGVVVVACRCYVVAAMHTQFITACKLMLAPLAQHSTPTITVNIAAAVLYIVWFMF
jgi:hypothetical protein